MVLRAFNDQQSFQQEHFSTINEQTAEPSVFKNVDDTENTSQFGQVGSLFKHQPENVHDDFEAAASCS